MHAAPGAQGAHSLEAGGRGAGLGWTVTVAAAGVVECGRGCRAYKRPGTRPGAGLGGPAWPPCLIWSPSQPAGAPRPFMEPGAGERSRLGSPPDHVRKGGGNPGDGQIGSQGGAGWWAGARVTPAPLPGWGHFWNLLLALEPACLPACLADNEPHASGKTWRPACPACPAWVRGPDSWAGQPAGEQQGFSSSRIGSWRRQLWQDSLGPRASSRAKRWEGEKWVPGTGHPHPNPPLSAWTTGLWRSGTVLWVRKRSLTEATLVPEPGMAEVCVAAKAKPHCCAPLVKPCWARG